MASPSGSIQRGGRALVFAPNPADAKWIDEELAGEQIAVEHAESVNEVVFALTAGPPPRAQILIADFDALSAADVLRLHSIREGWYGAIIGLGDVARDLRVSLNVAEVLARPFGVEVLRKAVKRVGVDKATTRMTKLPKS
jgi:hypothetical protein